MMIYGRIPFMDFILELYEQLREKEIIIKNKSKIIEKCVDK